KKIILCAVLLTASLASTVMAQRPLGIDVSSYQGHPTWSSVRGSGVVFAWAKATEGTTITDGDFTYNESNGKAAGIYMGADDFAHPNLNSPGSEAGHFWGVAGSYIVADGKSLMPTLDFEVFSGVVGASSYSDWANQWCNAIAGDAAGQGVTVKPVIYTSACSACNFNGSVASWIPWIADYNGQNLYTGTPWSVCTSCEVWGPGVWDVWQVSSSGAISGISGNVDLDTFNGNTSGMVSTLVSTAAAPTFNWYLRNENNAGGADVSFNYGDQGDLPLAGDWTRKGYMSAGLFRPGNTTFYLKNSNTSGGADITISYGVSGDIPVVGGWTNKALTTIGVYRPGNATFYLRNSK